MSAFWAVTEGLKNSSLVDAAWSMCIAAIGLFFLVRSGLTPRHLAAAALLLLWALRLGFFILWRNHGKGEDPRYTALREKWGKAAKHKMLFFFWSQGAAAAFFALPFILVSLNPAADLRAMERAAALLLCLAVAGETSADFSLAAHKKNPANRGKTCRAGLWNYSRHPNYFFEWLCWCAFALFASASPSGALAWACPALILYFLLKVSGIPMTEAQALKSRGEDYRAYQRTTSMFVPWFHK